MKALFLGFSTSTEMFEDIMRRESSMPVQTQRFGWAVVAALVAAGIEVRLVVAEPLLTFPHSRRILVRGRTFTEGGVEGVSLTFANLPVLKHLTRYLNARRALRTQGGSFDVILVHGVHSAFLWAAVHAGRHKGIPVVPILTDAPGLRNHMDGRISALLKRLDRWIVRQALSRCAGVVSLAPTLAQQLAPGLPVYLMEGIATDWAVEAITSREDDLIVTYAGRLDDAYGVGDLLESVDLAEERWTLWVAGAGPAQQRVESVARTHTRVRYLGRLQPSQMASLYARTDILINPRPPETDLAANSFPSKLLEYMATGVCVVTTPLPNLPDDYRDHVQLTEGGPVGLARSVDELVRWSPAERSEHGRAAREFILSTRGVEARGKDLRDFLTRIAARSL